MSNYANDRNYLTAAIEAQRLNDTVELTLQANTALVSDTEKPVISTTGNGIFYIQGKLKVTTGGAGMTLLTLPLGVKPKIADDYVVTVEASGGSFTPKPVHIDHTGIAAIGTPATDDVYHLGTLMFLADVE
jgi:hypothetical protein